MHSSGELPVLANRPNPGWNDRYIELVAETLEKCRIAKTKRLILNLLPQTLKSHAANVAFPAWMLRHDPSKQVICASYGQDLANKHARDCQTLMGGPF
jgi:hypothetical protein